MGASATQFCFDGNVLIPRVPLIGKCLQGISPRPKYSRSCHGRDSTEVAVAGRLNGSIACMTTLAASTEGKKGNRTKSTRVGAMNGAVELCRFLRKDL
jgi:hypothetical protein